MCTSIRRRITTPGHKCLQKFSTSDWGVFLKVKRRSQIVASILISGLQGFQLEESGLVPLTDHVVMGTAQSERRPRAGKSSVSSLARTDWRWPRSLLELVESSFRSSFRQLERKCWSCKGDKVWEACSSESPKPAFARPQLILVPHPRRPHWP